MRGSLSFSTRCSSAGIVAASSHHRHPERSDSPPLASRHPAAGVAADTPGGRFLAKAGDKMATSFDTLASK